LVEVEDFMSSMNGERGSIVISVMVILGIIYLAAFYFGSRGWGYSGYYGYNRGPSWMYWGGASTYHDPSVRSGSLGGPGHRGGGIGGGK
tara:strand:- start:161 stop:427 length:267 start_codon:yes stop_codon:yes gene_type:complete